MNSSKASRAATRKRVIKIVITDLGITLYAAYSERHDKLYLLFPQRYCSCPSYLFNVYLKGGREKCIHMEALEATPSKSLPTIRVDYSKFKDVFYPLIFRGFL